MKEQLLLPFKTFLTQMCLIHSAKAYFVLDEGNSLRYAIQSPEAWVIPVQQLHTDKVRQRIQQFGHCRQMG